MEQIVRKSLLRNIKLAELPTVLAGYKGTPLTGIKDSNLPKGFKFVASAQGETLRREMQFNDFKEAFRYFNLLTSTFSSLKYYPTVFNVYNLLVFDLATTHNNKATVTTKDLFAAHILNEILEHPQEGLKSAADKFNQL